MSSGGPSGSDSFDNYYSEVNINKLTMKFMRILTFTNQTKKKNVFTLKTGKEN